MNRQISHRCLSVMGQAAMATAVALLLSCSSTKQPAAGAAGKPANGSAAATKGSPADAQAAKDLLARAQKELDSKQYKSAREFANQAKAKGSPAADVDKLLAKIDAAEAAAAKKANAAKIDQGLEAAERKLDAGDFAGAEKDVAAVLALDPKNEDALDLQEEIREEAAEAKAKAAETAVEKQIDAAKASTKAGNYAEARKNIEAAKAAAAGTKSFDSAIAKAERALTDAESKSRTKANAAKIEGHLDKAEAMLKEDKFDLARKEVDEVLKLDKANSDAADMLQDISKAEAKFKSAAASRAAAEKVKSAKALADAGKHEEAKEAYSAILKEDPKNSDAKSGLEKAEKALAKAAEDAKAAAAKKLEADKKMAEASKAEEMKKAEAEKKAAADKAMADAKAAEAKKAEDARKAEEAKKNADAKAAAEMKKAEAEKAAAAKQAEATKGDAKKAFDSMLAEGDAAASKGDYSTAMAKYGEAAKKHPEFAAAANKKTEEVKKKQDAAAQADKAKAAKEARRSAEQAQKEGVTLYERGDLEGARERWREAKKIDPTYTEPDSFLAETEKEFNALMAKQQAKKQFEDAEAAAQEKMNTLISIKTIDATPLSDFLSNLRLLSGIDFVIAGGIDTRVEAAFEDKPLKQVLDSTLLELGLRWDRKPGEDIVTVSADLRTEVFTTTPDDLGKVKTLLENGTLPRLLYGPKGKPALEGQEIQVDDRQSIVVLTDSPRNLDKFRQFLGALRDAAPQALIYREYSIQGDKAPQIKALLGAILAADDKAPYNPERRLIVEGNSLVIRDTAANVAKAEEILKDKDFLTKFYSDKLTVATFNLTPVIEFEDDPSLARSFGSQVQEVVRTVLYAQEGESKAEREGRRLWWDPATLQLTITDYPENIEAVTKFIEKLPQIATKQRSKIFFLEWATAGDLASQIEEFLGQTADDTTSNAGGNSVTKTLSVEDEFTFRDARFRVSRVNDNDIADNNDDDVELIITTPTTSQESTIREFRSEFIEDFQVTVDDVKPSTTPGEGRARLTIAYTPGGRSGSGTETTPTPTPAVATEDLGLSIVSIDNLNALFVRYDTAEQLDEVEFWIKTLDIPTLQVNLETRFVETYDDRVRELKSDFVITDLTKGFDFSDAVVGARFAQDTDEFASPFEPALEGTERANMLKGVTNIGIRFLNGGSPIELNLRALEAAGIVNITNAPNITVLNNQTAEFLITRRLGLPTPVAGATSGGTGGNTNFTAVASEEPVNIEITPTITQAGNITLDLDLIIEDKEVNLGGAVALGGQDDDAAIPGGNAVTNTPGSYTRLRKEITTQARIKDGGTVVLGGWINNRDENNDSGVPLLRDIPFIGKLLFNREQKSTQKVTLNVFVTGQVLRD